MQGRYQLLTPAEGVSGPANGLIDAAADAQTADVRHLENIKILLEQVNDAGTVVLVTESSIDGVVWETVDASTAETDFAAGANVGVAFTLSDANGMPLITNFVRVRASALAGGGTYRMKVAGKVRAGY